MTTVKSVTNGNYKHTLAITLTSQNIAANTSLISYHYTIEWTGAGTAAFSTSTAYSFNVKINGNSGVNGKSDTESHTFDFRSSSSATFVSGTETLTHDSDGTLSISASFDGPTTSFSTGFPETTGSGTYVLPTIPRASTPTFQNSSGAAITSSDAGLVVTILTNPADSSFTHNITYSIGTASGTVATGVTSSTAWTIPMTLLNQIPNSISGSITISTETYDSSGDDIGGTNVSLTLTVGSSIIPTISSVTATEATTSPAVASIVGGFVQGLTTLAVAMTGAAGIYSSTIVSSSLSIDGQVISGTSGTTAVIVDSGTLVLTATIVDSRGRVGTRTLNVTVLPYAAPTVSTFTVSRALSSGTLDPNGTYFSINLIAVVQSLIVSSQKNDLHYAFKKQARGGTTPWSSITPDITTDAHAVSVSTTLLPGTYAITSSYDVRMEVTDALGTVASVQGTISTGGVLMNMSTTYDGIGIGKYWAQGSIDALGQIYQNNGQAVIDVSMVATTAALGITKLATSAQAIAGTDATAAVTSAALAAKVSSATAQGLVQLATTTEAITGTDTAKALTAADVAAVLNAAAPVKVTFSAVTSIELPCTGADEYEIEWVVSHAGTADYMSMQIGTSGTPIVTALYDSNSVYAGNTTPGSDQAEGTVKWHVSPGSSNTRANYQGKLTVLDLNNAAITRVMGVVSSDNTATDDASAAFYGKQRNATAYQSVFLITGSGTFSGYAVIKKVKYHV